MAALAKKPCDFPGCNYTTPVTWRFCSDRKCQSNRLLVRVFGDGTPEQQRVVQEKFDYDRAQEKKWSKKAQGYRREWKRGRRRAYTAYERRVILENSTLRSEQKRLVWETASPELRALIKEQEAEGYRVGMSKGDPWNALSLNAPLWDDDDRTLSDLIEEGTQVRVASTQIEWSDPTFWAALPELEIWLDAVRRHDRIGSPSFAEVRNRPAPEPRIQQRSTRKRRVA